MEIVYCDTCGLRISSNDASVSKLEDGRALCAKCRPPAPIMVAATAIAGTVATVPVGDAYRPRPSASGIPAARSSKRSAAESPRTSAPASRNTLVVPIAIGVSILCVAALAVVLSSGGKKEKVAAADEKTSGEPAPKSTSQPAPVQTVTPVKSDPLPETSVTGVSKSGSSTDPEAVAQAAYGRVFDGVAKDDNAAKIQRLEQFVKDCDPDTMTAARARIDLEKLKKPPAPTPVTPAPPVKPVPPRNAAPKASTDDLTSFFHGFEGGGEGVAFGSVVGNLPGNNVGKALKLAPAPNMGARGGVYAYDYPAGSVQRTKNAVVFMTEGARLRFRYFSTGASLFDVRTCEPVAGKTEPVVYVRPFKAAEIKSGEWKDVDIMLNELHTADGKTLTAGMAIPRIEFWAYPEKCEFFIDDLSVLPGPKADAAKQ